MNKVLIVEDEDIIRKGLMFMAKWNQYDCVVVGEAINGEDGLRQIKEKRPDIVIVDINMPEKDGLSMIEESIELYGYDAIIISGHSEFSYAKKAISLGVSEYLLKPINFNELYPILEKITSKRNHLQQLHQDKKQIDIEKARLSLISGEEPSHSNKYVTLMLDSIRTGYRNRLSLTDISIECGMSCTYLNTKLKQYTGYTFNDYLNRYRIQQAIKLLNENELKVYEIADEVGFADYKYFIKVFKKYIGISPVKFIESEHFKEGSYETLQNESDKE